MKNKNGDPGLSQGCPACLLIGKRDENLP